MSEALCFNVLQFIIKQEKSQTCIFLLKKSSRKGVANFNNNDVNIKTSQMGSYLGPTIFQFPITKLVENQLK
jgi:hypothetical protein